MLLNKLCSAEQPPRLVDLERLYHSCRLNREVTRETLKNLQQLWSGTTNEGLEFVCLLVNTILTAILWLF